MSNTILVSNLLNHPIVIRANLITGVSRAISFAPNETKPVDKDIIIGDLDTWEKYRARLVIVYDYSQLGFGGATGPQGQTGPSGGPQGVTGLTGATGVGGGGATGLRGVTGPQGVTGLRGSTGVGTQGATGAGTQGATGAGTQGATGLQGITGPGAGLQGVTGLQGATGLAGTAGTQGTTGVAGTAGTQGVTGLAGTAGTQGVTGIGTQGATGAGTQGATGAGTQGATGLQGITGPGAGLQGVTGLQGATGTAGSAGTQGVTGVAGSAGTQGVTGLAGTAGTQGVTGLAGSAGSQGVTGLQGFTGAGTQGTTGAGTQGVTGLPGVTGPSGGGTSSGTVYNQISLYQAESTTSQEVWVRSSSSAYSGLSWSRTGTTLTLTRNSHGHSIGDRVIIRETNEDYLSAVITATATNTFDVTCNNTGATSGTTGSYSLGFRYAHNSNTPGAITTGTLSAPAGGNVQLLGIQVHLGSGTRSSTTYDVILPASVTNGAGADTSNADIWLPMYMVRNDSDTLTAIGATMAKNISGSFSRFQFAALGVVSTGVFLGLRF